MKTFVESQFIYCSLNWMFHFISLNNKINDVHEKALRIVYSDYKSTFREPLDKDASFSVSHRNIQTLAMEIYNILLGVRQQLWGKFSELIELYYITSGQCVFQLSS